MLPETELAIDQPAILYDPAYADLGVAQLLERDEDGWPQHTALLVVDEKPLLGHAGHSTRVPFRLPETVGDLHPPAGRRCQVAHSAGPPRSHW
ncbi:hypothetical protein [Streptomyces sp. NPDC018352]|uniref:hypothetical protein n=1 Tax=Streptomyces sp. NPDC018352 TaxID=3157194 RepID=UPI0033EFFF2A